MPFVREAVPTRLSSSVSTFIMLSFKSLAFAFAALSVAGVEGGPCRACVPTNIVQDSDFEGDASPWDLTSGVEIRADTAVAALAHSPDHYV